MRRLSMLVAVAALVGVLGGVAAADGHLASGAFDAQLTGEMEVPPVETAGSGYVVLEMAEDDSAIDYRLYATGLDDVTMAHIHVGAEGENGPPVVFLFGPADPPLTSDGLLAEGTVTEANLLAVDGVFDGTMGQLAEMIRSGDTYVNVHTVANPAGEIRGQLELASFNFAAPLAGSSEVPPVGTSGTGFTSLSLDGTQTSLDYRLVTFGLDGTVMAHIHVAPPGVNGPVVVFLFGPDEDGVTRDGLLAEGTITEEDLIAVTDVFDGTMETLIDHLRGGTAYVNVHTMAHPAGEIRGQVEGLTRTADAFTDDDESIHEGDIETIASAGITRGCNPPANDQFCPQDGFTRGQAAAFFTRALNLLASNEDAFVDDEGSVFEGDINAIAALGVTAGCNPPTNDRYCPDDTVTRAQWASFMTRALGLTAGADDDRFTDDDDSVHEGDINVIAAAGITLGCNPPDNDEFCPDDIVTRQQAASFFVRALGWRSLAG